jgi:hypothetical protein
MLGWFLDDIVVFRFRTILRYVRQVRSRNWPVASGTVEESRCVECAMYPSAQLVYSYTVLGKGHSGTYKRGFWYRSSAKRYASRFTPSSRLVVRYRPDVPAESFIREEDQTRLNAAASALPSEIQHH